MSVRAAIVPGRPGLTLGPVGVVLRPRRLAVAAILGAALLALAAIALTQGTLSLPLDRVLAALVGEGSRAEELVVVEHRAPRALLAAIVGAALGLAGAITQSITRNPLASPDILGTTAGASMFAVLAIVPLAGTAGVLEGASDAAAQLGTAAAALLGAALVSALVIASAWRGRLDGMRLVLAGIGCTAVSQAVVSWVLLAADIDDVDAAQRWLVGSLGRAGWAEVAVLGATLALCAAAMLMLARPFDAIHLGPDTARALGVSVAPTLVATLGIAVVLAAVATSTVGPIGFIAFVAPQLALRLFRTPGPEPASAALTGALLVLAADRLAASLPVSLPVGIVTALLGAPFLAYFVVRASREASA